MRSNCGVGEDSWESLGQQEDPTSPEYYWIFRKSVLNIHWKAWRWSWSSNTLATWCAELTYWKRPWCWERLKVEGEGDNREWDGWMALPTQWTWVWVSSRSWWWTGRPGVLQSMGSQRVGHDWATELNWTELICNCTKMTLVRADCVASACSPLPQPIKGLAPLNVGERGVSLWTGAPPPVPNCRHPR